MMVGSGYLRVYYIVDFRLNKKTHLEVMQNFDCIAQNLEMSYTEKLSIVSNLKLN